MQEAFRRWVRSVVGREKKCLMLADWTIGGLPVTTLLLMQPATENMVQMSSEYKIEVIKKGESRASLPFNKALLCEQSG